MKRFPGRSEMKEIFHQSEPKERKNVLSVNPLWERCNLFSIESAARTEKHEYPPAATDPLGRLIHLNESNSIPYIEIRMIWLSY